MPYGKGRAHICENGKDALISHSSVANVYIINAVFHSLGSGETDFNTGGNSYGFQYEITVFMRVYLSSSIANVCVCFSLSYRMLPGR